MTRKALLVGINDYAPHGPGGPDLNGCVNDVKDVAHTLNALGIVPARPGSMRILTDSRATRENIMKGLAWLIKGSKSGDVLVFHYSGHGSQLVDTDIDEPDRKDETLCPHDYATAGMIRDDDLRRVLATLPRGVNMDVIFDSCHSGTGTRDLAAPGCAPKDGELTFRYIDPPVDYGYFINANPTLPVQRILKQQAGERQAVEVKLNHVLWAGCRDNQTSAETMVGGSVRGIFTYCYCKALRRAGVGVTRRKLDALVSVDVRNMGYAQVPQLEGTKKSLDEKVFT